MKTRLLHIWELLATSYWFVPSVFVLAAAVSSFLLMEVDERWGASLLKNFGWLDRMSAEGVRVLLGTVAASSLTLMAVTFSATVVSLTMAASQFGPRLLRNFMRSATNQVTLGLLLATFVFSLLVLRNVRSGADAFVPHFSTFGVFLLLLSALGFFIVFLHRLSTSIQAEHVVADVLHELESMINEAYPRADSEAKRSTSNEQPSDSNAAEMTVRFRGRTSGYLQAINREPLMEFAHSHDLSVEVMARPGDFVLAGEAVAVVKSNATLNDADELEEQISLAFLVGDHRTPEQDVLYGIRQLVEIALRALSPGINDPFTAINCIHALSAALSKILARPTPQFRFHDSEGTLRASLRHHSFAEIVDASFALLRPSAKERPEVALAIVESLARVVSICREKNDVHHLRDEAGRIAEGVAAGKLSALDAGRLKKAVEELNETVGAKESAERCI